MWEEWDSRPEFGFSPQSEISASLGLEQGESCTCEKKEKKGGGGGWGWRSTAGRPAHKSIIHPNPQCSQFSFQPKSSPKPLKLTYLRMLNVWGGIHRRGGRPRRGGGAAEGSSGQTLLSCRCNRPELEDWKFGKNERKLVYLNSCITVVRGDYSVLDKDKIDWTTWLPPVNRKLISMLLFSCIISSFSLFQIMFMCVLASVRV